MRLFAVSYARLRVKPIPDITNSDDRPINAKGSRLLDLAVLISCSAVAILGVLLLHAGICSRHLPAILAVPSAYGWSGVDLFFVLSGYLIGGAIVRSSAAGAIDGIGSFWIRRWFRLFHYTLLFFFVYVVVKPAIGYPFLGWNRGYLVFLQNYAPLIDFQQSWSLCVEEQFYLVFPIAVLLLGLRTFRPWLWLAPAASSLALRAIFVGHAAGTIEAISLIRDPIYTHADGISMGIFLSATATSLAILARTHAPGDRVGKSRDAHYGVRDDYRTMGAGYRQRIWIYYHFCRILGHVSGMCGPATLRTLKATNRENGDLVVWSYLWNNLLMRAFDHLPLPWMLVVPLFIHRIFRDGCCDLSDR